MDEGAATLRLNKHQLIAVEKGLFELIRQQKASPNTPVELVTPNFWSAIGQLLHHLEMELAETIRNEGMTAKAQLQSRRLGVARTSVTDLTRMRMNAFAQHAVLSTLMQGPQGDVMGSRIRVPRLEWTKHDPAERVYHTGVGRLVEQYKHEVSWNALLHGGNGVSVSPPSPGGNAALSEFTPVEKEPQMEVSDAIPAAPPIDEKASSAPISRTVSQTVPSAVSDLWDDPDFDEEDRIRQMDAFPERATGAAPAASEIVGGDEATGSDLRRILILQDMADPIIAEDGSKIHLTAGDVESCPALLAETLIAAGLAEAADL